MARTKQTDILGDIADIGRNIFGGVHTAGKILASAFGAGKAADSLEQIETKAGLLPSWAASSSAQPQTVPNKVTKVAAPDYLVLVPKSGGAPVIINDAAQVTVTGGARFAGNGYKKGDKVGSTFSFGFDQPTSVSVLRRNSMTASTDDVKQAIFLGGNEGQQVVGYHDAALRAHLYPSLTELPALAAPPYDNNQARSNEMSVDDLEKQVIEEVTSEAPGAGWDEILGAGYTVGSKPSCYGQQVVGAGIVAPHTPINLATAAAAAHAGAIVTPKQVAQQRVQPRAGFQVKVTPKGRTFTSLQPNRNKKTQTASIKNARDVAARSAKVADGILQKLSGQSVRGIIGAVAAPKRPGAAAALAKVKKMAADVKTNAAKLSKQADKHEAAFTGFKAKVDAGVKVTRAKTDPSGRSAIHGYGADSLRDAIAGDLYSTFPTYPTAPTSPYPTSPYGSTGVDPTTGLPYPTSPYGSTGAIDPTTGLPYGSAGAGAIDPTTGLPMGGAGSLASQLPGPPDYGLGPAPTKAPPLKPGIDFLPDPGIKDETVYQNVPDESCIVYDGSHGFPEKSVGSFTYYYGKLSSDTSSQLMCGKDSGFFMGDDGKWKYWCASAYNDGAAIDHRTMHPNDEESTSMPALAQSSQNHLWGPIIGNPKGALKGLRYAMLDDKWFWFRDQAPPWATQADDLVRQQQAITDYKTALLAAQTDYANAQYQDQVNAQAAQQQAQQQAQEDAASARQYQQELQQAQHDADMQAAQQQTQQTALDQQWQQQQMQMMQQQAQQDQQDRQQRAQMQQARLQMAQQAQEAQIQLMQTNPQLFAQMQAQAAQDQQDQAAAAYSGDVEDGVDWGTANDDFERAASGRSTDETSDDLEEGIDE